MMPMHHPQQGMQQGMPNPQYMPAPAPGAPPPQQPRPMPPVNEAMLRRSRKPTDKTIPEGVEEVVIGDGVEQYKNLRELEKRLDAAMVRKRLDIQDSISRTVKRYRTLRIWISNTVEDQPWQKAREQNGHMSIPGSGRYKVKIEGRLLDDDSDPTVADEDSEVEDEEVEGEKKDGDDGQTEEKKKSKPRRPLPRFSHFFKSITIDFDKTNSARPEDLNSITWSKPQLPPNQNTLPPNADFDSLSFTRASQENLNITISLVRDETPERYKLSKELADVLDVTEDTRSGVVMGIWDYIRAMGLQGNQEKREVRCDEKLKAVRYFPFIILTYYANKSRSSDGNKCSSHKSLKRSARTCHLSIQSSFPTQSASTKTSTTTQHPQSMTSASPTTTRCGRK